MRLIQPYVTQKSFDNWVGARGFLESLGPRYVFRGHGEGAWSLSTSIERSCLLPRLIEVERLLRGAFQSAAHLYEAQLPQHNDPISWLALMQHHRVPTRLMDWTQSPHVAAYFAAAHEPRPDSAYCIWALDILKLKRAAIQQVKRKGNKTLGNGPFGRSKSFAQIAINNQIRCVAPVQPSHSNLRQVNQRALFLCPTDLGISFEDNLAAMADLLSGMFLYKVTLPHLSRVETLRDLYSLNVQPATLFQGMDGFCDSMRMRLRLLQEVGHLQWKSEFQDVLDELWLR